METKTIPQMIEDLKKEKKEREELGVSEEHTGHWSYDDVLEAKLSTLQEAKNMFLGEINKKLSNIDYSLDNLDNNEEFQDMEEYERDEYLNNLYGMRQGLQELKSKIGGEDD